MKILIVDDNSDNRMTVELLLEEFENIEISEAKDGQEAIDMCKKKHYDIIFMDIMMPNVDGIKATKIIKSFDKKVMILALSALDDEESKNQMLANGAEDYIVKPIESGLFHQRMKNYLQIVELRKRKLYNVNAVNAFTEKIYSRTMVFNISSLQSLSELWDYYLNNHHYEIESLEDCIRMIYAYGQLNLKKDQVFTIVAEENDDNLYLTLTPLDIISELVIQKTLVKNYSSAIFILKNKELSFRLPKAKPISIEKVEKIEVTDYQQNILGKVHFSKTTAADYVENTAVYVIDKIEILESTLYEVEIKAIAFEKDASKNILLEITELFETYINVVEELIEFEHFAYALKTLNEFMRNLDIEHVDPADHKKFALLFMLLLDDIGEWRNNIFIKIEANDVHYLDSSLLSSCLQLQSIFEKKEVSQQDEDDFELF
ncbi:response regulator [Candidatus Sulfurimonas baltica]|uniref:Response regulator n=1 Tax=Candidatus Sulfurimonas baltica TaxID=2740404 RepID=A0A7S7LXQ0_9BACT|nr:response regulator [Candidatus Sulfurimonas baltica]QOY53357.1 response regulator [Candidatus Sulfurimonas baltica]